MFLTVPLRKGAIRQEFCCYCEVTTDFKRSHYADVIRDGNEIIIVSFTAHDYWDRGTLLRSWHTTEIVAHYRDHGTLLRSVHVTEIIVHYWDHGTLLRSLHFAEIMAHYWGKCTLLRSLYITEIMAHYWDRGTLPRSWHITEISARYWDHCTLLKSWHTTEIVHITEIMAHYWDQCTLLKSLYITEIMAHYWDHSTLLKKWYILKKKRTRTFSVVHKVLNEKQTPGKCRDVTRAFARESTLVTKRRRDKNQVCDVTPSRKSTRLSKYCLCLKYCNRLRVMWWPGTKIQRDPDWWYFGRASSTGLLYSTWQLPWEESGNGNKLRCEY